MSPGSEAQLYKKKGQPENPEGGRALPSWEAVKKKWGIEAGTTLYGKNSKGEDASVRIDSIDEEKQTVIIERYKLVDDGQGGKRREKVKSEFPLQKLQQEEKAGRIVGFQPPERNDSQSEVAEGIGTVKSREEDEAEIKFEEYKLDPDQEVTFEEYKEDKTEGDKFKKETDVEVEFEEFKPAVEKGAKKGAQNESIDAQQVVEKETLDFLKGLEEKAKVEEEQELPEDPTAAFLKNLGEAARAQDEEVPEDELAILQMKAEDALKKQQAEKAQELRKTEEAAAQARDKAGMESLANVVREGITFDYVTAFQEANKIAVELGEMSSLAKATLEKQLRPEILANLSEEQLEKRKAGAEARLKQLQAKKEQGLRAEAAQNLRKLEEAAAQEPSVEEVNPEKSVDSNVIGEQIGQVDARDEEELTPEDFERLEKEEGGEEVEQEGEGSVQDEEILSEEVSQPEVSGSAEAAKKPERTAEEEAGEIIAQGEEIFERLKSARGANMAEVVAELRAAGGPDNPVLRKLEESIARGKTPTARLQSALTGLRILIEGKKQELERTAEEEAGEIIAQGEEIFERLKSTKGANMEQVVAELRAANGPDNPVVQKLEKSIALGKTPTARLQAALTGLRILIEGKKQEIQQRRSSGSPTTGI